MVNIWSRRNALGETATTRAYLYIQAVLYIDDAAEHFLCYFILCNNYVKHWEFIIEPVA
jgi:hypothetical protein